MSRYLQALDPRRSLATAVAWFAVVLSLAIALALLTVGDFALNSMLAQRDAQMMRFATRLAIDLEGAVAGPGGVLALPSRQRLGKIVEAAREEAKPDPRARVLLLDDRHDIVFQQPEESSADVPLTLPRASLQIGGNGEHQVVVTAPLSRAPGLRSLGIRVAVVQPSEESGHGGTLQEKLTAISILLSIFAALIGVAFARRLTRRLSDLTSQVRKVANQEAEGIVEPAGFDEVAVLGRAFGRLLNALRQEHAELDQLTRELEQRVQARTREVERLAADSRYAAVVRERLRFARDLHDTLAHSMMEMLVEVRTLRMLHAHDPQRLAAELERAEEVAREGLKEARDAVSHMRLNAVRDLGLGAALSGATVRFAERTGLEVSYRADPQAASFADERAETVFRIAEEALRNIDRHARAAHVEVALLQAGDGEIELVIADDGVGFDPESSYPGHFGVTGIREHAQLIGARLELQSRPGAGTRLCLRLRVGPEMREGGDLGHDRHQGGLQGPAQA
ncbi:histidine kinase [Ideonella sp. YS5]|uniref:sensor histidine kinase n=1 Tax=Ideonella sp. YS5 TaxID=3453714 RepID=UPI003EEB405C